MTEQPASTLAQDFWNVPNQLTVARIVLAVVLFAMLPLGWYWAGLAVFVLAALTDAADGYWARKYDQVTQLGRIIDPFADKLVICGVFVFLVEVPDSLVAAWMAVIIIARELLVTVLRGFIEGHGGDFSAKWVGKWKMILQCAAVILCLVRLGMMQQNAEPVAWLDTSVLVTLWATVALTAYSGVSYSLVAVKMMARQ